MPVTVLCVTSAPGRGLHPALGHTFCPPGAPRKALACPQDLRQLRSSYLAQRPSAELPPPRRGTRGPRDWLRLAQAEPLAPAPARPEQGTAVAQLDTTTLRR